MLRVMTGFSAWIAVHIFACCYASDLYSDAVRNYDTETFKNNIGNDMPHFVNFFAPWCGYCKRLTPVWNELAEKFNMDPVYQKLVIAKVDCTVETPLCAEQGVSGYPSLIFYSSQNAEGVKYKGKREIVALEEFIALNTDSKDSKKKHRVLNFDSGKGAHELTSKNFHSTIDWGTHFVKFYAPWCGHCLLLAPIWDELSDTSDGSVKISKIDCTVHKDACSEFEITAYPTLIWIHNGKIVQKYKGQHTLADLKHFISDMTSSTKNEVTDSNEGRIPETPEKVLTDFVVQLSAGNFENAVQQGVVFVKFFAPWCGHCRRLAPVWEELARKFVTTVNVKIAKVDCTIDNDLCNSNMVQGYPTLYIFRNGERLKEYKGARDLESLHEFVKDYLQHDEL